MELCESLVKWLQTFEGENPSQSAEALMDGVMMAQALHQISPRFFSTVWLSKINTGATSDWRLKVSNMKKIQKAIVDFYADSLGQQLNDSHLPNVTSMVEHSDKRELGRLLQLVLGCAVNCENKHEYIQRIMSMEESVQHDVMRAIQELMTKEVPPSSPQESSLSLSERQIQKLTDELQKMADEKDAYAQRCHDLDLQVVLLMEAKANLLTEVDRLNERLNQADTLDDPSSVAGRRYAQMQRQVDQLQEDLYRAETARDDFRIKADSLMKEFTELQQKNEEIESSLDELNQLKDEIDILRHSAEKVPKYEASIASYKKKLEELSNVRGEVKLLEEKNLTLMQKNLDLEEDVKKGSVIKTQLETYKRQFHELQLKFAEETKRADKAEFEAKRQLEKVSVLSQDKQHLIEERNSLREMVDELRCSQQSMPQHQLDVHTASPGSFELMSLPPDIRERVLRLQHENQLLKMQTSSGEDSQFLRGMLDDANAHSHELECQVRSLNQRIVELEATVADMAEVRDKISSDEDAASSELRKRLNEQVDKCRKSEADLQKIRTQAEEFENKLQTSVDEIGELRNLLAKKDVEMKEMEEKYKKYLDKAKTVIRQMDPKNNQSLATTQPEVAALKAQLVEKTNKLKEIEEENGKSKALHAMEEELIVSAWYNLGSMLHRKTADERLAAGSPAAPAQQQSFLARQRQVHVRPRAAPASSISPSAAALPNAMR